MNDIYEYHWISIIISMNDHPIPSFPIQHRWSSPILRKLMKKSPQIEGKTRDTSVRNKRLPLAITIDQYLGWNSAGCYVTCQHLGRTFKHVHSFIGASPCFCWLPFRLPTSEASSTPNGSSQPRSHAKSVSMRRRNGGKPTPTHLYKSIMWLGKFWYEIDTSISLLSIPPWWWRSGI